MSTGAAAAAAITSHDVPTRVLLLRHGQSTWNAERRWQGQADPPLSGLGQAQAVEAAKLLGTFDLVIASDLERARRTAELIAAQLGIGPVQLDQRLRENHAGEWQGLTREEIDCSWPGYVEQHRRPPGFEPAEEVQIRALAALIEIGRAVGDGEVLAVTHGGVIRVLRRLLDVSDVAIPNLAGCWLEVSEQPTPRIVAGEPVHLLTHADNGLAPQPADDGRDHERL